MPSFGLGEILLILVVIVLFIRPEDLPRFIRNFGRVYGDIQRFFVRMRSFSKETLTELAQADSMGADKRISAPSTLSNVDDQLSNKSEIDLENSQSDKKEGQSLQKNLPYQPVPKTFEEEYLGNCEENSKQVDAPPPKDQKNLPGV